MDEDNISENPLTEKMDTTTVGHEIIVNNKDYKEYEDEIDTSDEEVYCLNYYCFGQF